MGARYWDHPDHPDHHKYQTMMNRWFALALLVFAMAAHMLWAAQRYDKTLIVQALSDHLMYYIIVPALGGAPAAFALLFALKVVIGVGEGVRAVYGYFTGKDL